MGKIPGVWVPCALNIVYRFRTGKGQMVFRNKRAFDGEERMNDRHVSMDRPLKWGQIYRLDLAGSSNDSIFDSVTAACRFVPDQQFCAAFPF